MQFHLKLYKVTLVFPFTEFYLLASSQKKAQKEAKKALQTFLAEEINLPEDDECLDQNHFEPADQPVEQ